MDRQDFCLLCLAPSDLFYREPMAGTDYYRCRTCDLIFMNPNSRLDAERERSRYEFHENHVDDLGYQNFVRPLYHLIKEALPVHSKGLDFGCGEGPVLAYLLSNDGYDIQLYDPFFHPEPAALERRYDFIFAVETAEHFYNPLVEFGRLKQLLKPGGSLTFMTSLYTDEINFGSWHYRMDPTHVCFYSDRTVQWIQTHFGFSSYVKHGDRIAWLDL